ncbi:MAG TPA: winged helix-turn-helix domain-containing protein [Nitrososphaera sp.]
MGRVRSMQDIVAEILQSVQEPKTKYQVILEARSNTRQIRNYLNVMHRSKLIRTTPDNMLVATEKGRELLRLYRQAEKMLGGG